MPVEYKLLNYPPAIYSYVKKQIKRRKQNEKVEQISVFS